MAPREEKHPKFLTLPYVLHPGQNHVYTAWVTTPVESGRSQVLLRGDKPRAVTAESRPLTRLPGTLHIARIDGLAPGETVEYAASTGDLVTSYYTCRSKPAVDAGVRFLLTSDSQSMPLAAPAIAQVPNLCPDLDFILYPGDLADHPYLPEDWWSELALGDPSGAPRHERLTQGFFPIFQGTARLEWEGGEIRTSGAPLLQRLPLYACPGNHEVSGENGFHGVRPLNVDPKGWNVTSFEELFGPPELPVGRRRYYSFTYGNIAFAMLFVSRAWRPGNHNLRSGLIYEETHPGDPERWSYGCFPFELITPGSPQYRWLEQTLRSRAFQEAEYRIVAMHHPIFTRGHDRLPPFVEPQAVEVRDRSEGGPLIARRYEYPPDQDILRKYLVPLFKATGVHLVVNGHSHVYSRFNVGGITYVESSNLGNTYGWNPLEVAGEDCRAWLSNPNESYFSVIDTREPGGLGVTYCAQDSRVVDAFRIKTGGYDPSV